MTGNVPFLMKDVVLLAVSLYLLKEDVARVHATRWQVVHPGLTPEMRKVAAKFESLGTYADLE